MASEQEKEEIEIVDRVVQGEREVFRVLVERYQSDVIRLGMRFFRNREDALDFAQDVMVRTFRNLAGWRRQGRFRAWLMRLAYNHAVNMKRRGNEPMITYEDHYLDTNFNPERQMLQREAGTTLLEAMKSLPWRFALCLDLFFFFGMTYDDISRVTGFPVNTIKSHVFRAKSQLRSVLSGSIAEVYDEL